MKCLSHSGFPQWDVSLLNSNSEPYAYFVSAKLTVLYNYNFILTSHKSRNCYYLLNSNFCKWREKKREISFTKEFQIIYEDEPLSPSRLVLVTHFQRIENGREKYFFTVEKHGKYHLIQRIGVNIPSDTMGYHLPPVSGGEKGTSHLWYSFQKPVTPV